MTNRAVQRRPRRMLLALVLVVVAVLAIVVEPFPGGPTLLPITPEHGVDAGDLPAVTLLLAAAWLVMG
jgi:hypothetical protein